MKKSMSSICFLLLSSVCALPSYGGSFDDTIRLASIQVEARRQHEMFYIGSQLKTLDSELLKNNPTATIAELLAGDSHLSIKSMGGSGVATASFRGASSSQTQTNWNGVSIVSPTLGNFDFSQIPALFIDEIALLYGGGSSKTGLGALGGSVDIRNRPDFSGPSITATGEYGTYNAWSQGIRVRMGNSRTSATTRLLYHESDNNYRYPNPALPQKARRENAAYSSVGAMQDIYHVLKGGGLLSANVWFERFDNDIPNPIAVASDSKNSQVSSSLRSMVGYNKSHRSSDYKFTMAYIRDMTDYTSLSQQWGDYALKTIINSYVTRFDYLLNAGKSFDIGASVNYRHDNVLSDNFDNSQAHRNAVSAQISSLWHPGERFSMRAQYSPLADDGRFANTYAVGLGYDIVPGLLSVGATNSYNHRFPTVNDLYFSSGGNPDLLPEKGFAFDATLTFTPVVGAIKFKFDATYFNLNIIDWIEWAPESEGSWTWLPQNLKHVLSRGVESSLEAEMKTGRANNKLSFNYSHTSTVNQGTSNTQLQYVPFNKWNTRYTFEQERFYASYSISHSGNRYDDNHKIMKPYALHAVQAGYTFGVGSGMEMRLSGRVSNLFNTYYQSTANYPMPLRMGHIMLTFMM